MTWTTIRSRGSARRWRRSRQGDVDCVVVFGEPMPEQLMGELEPDVLAKGP